jgi:hypothetical protein
VIHAHLVRAVVVEIAYSMHGDIHTLDDFSLSLQGSALHLDICGISGIHHGNEALHEGAIARQNNRSIAAILSSCILAA